MKMEAAVPIFGVPVEAMGMVEPLRTAAGIDIPSTPDEVEEGLIEAWQLWRRSPGGGRWPFAADGPWHLVSRKFSEGDWDNRGVDGEAPPPRESGLSQKEVARRDALSAWLQFAPDRDRRLVCLVIEQLARGRQRPDFMVLRPMFPNAHGKALGADGLRKRYGRALSAIARAVGAGVARSSQSM